MLRKMLLALNLLVAALLLSASPSALLAANPVKMWEEDITIPTYPVGAPEKNPMFYHGRTYQGAKGPVYPYPFLEKLTEKSQPKTYHAVYLENDYVRLCILPELGGRIFSAQDKTDGYDFFYRQNVIKPALIGALGAWISGGVEWNVPHHHRASTFMPVDYTLSDNPDGSRTVWVGETELRHRIKWMVGLTLHPDRSWVEARVRVMNPTPLVHSFLYFANVAVHADSAYQVIFPPTVDWGVGHAKHEFTRWPLSDNIYGLPGYQGTVDVSLWKTHPSPISIFAWESTEDFMGGYDHGKQAGVLHVADHNVVPGKKFFEWGPGNVGREWDKILTDTDGPYLEIMVGAYSDNQPDYSWLQPGEVKTFTQRWYPIRQLGGAKNANSDAAVNLELKDGQALVGFNVTSERPGARVVLKRGMDNVLDKKVDLGPGQPFVETVPLPSGAKETELSAVLYDSAGSELVAYQPVERQTEPKPDPVTPPAPPAEIKTIEGLYLAGMRLEEFHSAAMEPDPYYEEALSRDPGDYRVNTALGILYLKRGRFDEARRHLETAVARAGQQHTRPRDGEALYYLGVVREFLGDYAGAAEAYNRASWSMAWTSQTCQALARLDCRRGDFRTALAHIERAGATNADNTRIACLKAAILRHLGWPDGAWAVTTQALKSDPLDFSAAVEQALDKGGAVTDPLDGATAHSASPQQARLEIACDYAGAGLAEEAVEVLLPATTGTEPVNPLVYYYLADLSAQLGQTDKASGYLDLAAKMSPDLVFPFRLETIGVLLRAMQARPRDPRAPYYLGNLLFDRQPQESIRLWELSVSLDPKFATVQRNLGIAYAWVRKDIPAATASLEAAARLAPEDPRVRLELDQMYEAGGMAPDKRLAGLQKYHRLALKNDELLSREITLLLNQGQYDKALEEINGHYFHTWEGGVHMHDLYFDACILRGDRSWRKKDYKAALADFQAALIYPDNLEDGRPLDGGSDCEADYFIGRTYAAMGDKAKAGEYYEKALESQDPPPELRWCQGLALRGLGREDEAKKVFADLVDRGRKRLAGDTDNEFFSKFGRRRMRGETMEAQLHYLVGLGLVGQGDTAGAKAEFQKALDLDANQAKAAWQLAQLK